VTTQERLEEADLCLNGATDLLNGIRKRVSNPDHFPETPDPQIVNQLVIIAATYTNLADAWLHSVDARKK